MTRFIIRFQRLQPRLHFIQCSRIQQLAQIRVAQQFFKLRLINRQRLRPPLRQWRISVIDIIRHIGE